MSSALLVSTDSRGVAAVALNRPERHNAFDDAMIQELGEALERLGQDAGVRAVVLRGEGRSFCAGADLNWMKRMAGYGEAENVADADRLGQLMRTLNELPKPTVALVQGNAFAGGLGLVTACDIAVAAEDAVFSVSEVKLGLIPSVISPYLVAAIGPRAARRYFLTAERFPAAEARRLGLVHETVPREALAAAGERFVAMLLENGPKAMAGSKRLISDVAFHPISDALIGLTVRRIAETRASPEGREGIAAFLEKRKPGWRTLG
jgi:methylglutaconyl-CoA hydratase